ncbi:MAG: hypothetical protein OXC81_04920 [Betaproteobacteria bacterium]|nr:hypothetical protein [Betaproteobacteria bacterium]
MEAFVEMASAGFRTPNLEAVSNATYEAAYKEAANNVAEKSEKEASVANHKFAA